MTKFKHNYIKLSQNAKLAQKIDLADLWLISVS